MKVIVGGFLQGICDSATAEKAVIDFDDVVIVATCIACGHHQKIEKVSEKCNACDSLATWK
jgi:Zn finger protein HypA/HybF involved in hydrogenase expression